ncbi:hypothetical protein LWI29_007665 [Acer saccharum]|uniref:Uncharacterized protein n=1 Tax=Acer saccharum TaxID=4024 RepID=A0AA39VX52_ACESA|nr:hypothetical protein LWI29_007665 [Acer saccharum]
MQVCKEEGGYRADHIREELGVKRSFAEAVRGSQRAGFGQEDEEREKMKSMQWDFRQKDQDWLKKCAIGILKGFKEQLPDLIRVKVHGGQMPLVIKMEVDAIPVDVGWLESFLALRKKHVQLCRNSRPEMERFQNFGSIEVGEACLRSSTQVGKAMSYQEVTCQDSRSDLTAKGKLIGQSKRARRSWGVGIKKPFDKGKKKWCKKILVRPKFSMIQNGKLVLDKRKVSDLAGVVRTAETSSSSEEEHGGKVFLESARERGECSKKMGQIGEDVSAGPKLLSKPKKVFFRLSSEGPSSVKAIHDNERVDLCVDLGQVAVRPMDERIAVGMVSGKEAAAVEDGSSSDSLATKEELVQATIEVESQFQCGRDGEPGESEEGEDVSSDNQLLKDEMIRENIEAEKESAVVSTVADSEEEMVRSKMQGNRLRSRNQSRSASIHGMKTRHSNNLQNRAMAEAVRVMEIGSVLGFDFSCGEEEVFKEIARREEEDNERYQAKSG